jgi:large subunit ribosomal protein L1
MGQKKVKTIDLSEKEEKKDKTKKTQEKEVKKDKKASSVPEKKNKEEKGKKAKITKTKKRQKHPISKRFKKLKTKVDKQKLYEPEQAVDLLLSLASSKIDETVELNIVTSKDKLMGSVNLPHGTGKKQKISIADSKLLKQIEKGNTDFDILIATPKMMPQIAKVAKILGPKGLMPNPKTGTITEEPEKLKKKLEQGEVKYRTETKAPLIHMIIGKISFGKEKLMENLETALKNINPRNIKKANISSTQSPGINLDLSPLKKE